VSFRSCRGIARMPGIGRTENYQAEHRRIGINLGLHWFRPSRLLRVSEFPVCVCFVDLLFAWCVCVRVCVFGGEFSGQCGSIEVWTYCFFQISDSLFHPPLVVNMRRGRRIRLWQWSITWNQLSTGAHRLFNLRRCKRIGKS
jgi:hypothetical protein